MDGLKNLEKCLEKYIKEIMLKNKNKSTKNNLVFYIFLGLIERPSYTRLRGLDRGELYTLDRFNRCDAS